MRRTSSSSSSDSNRSLPIYRRNRSLSAPNSVRACKKKASRDCIRLLIVGDHSVGKSALAVKLLTQRFIGTYQNERDMVYQNNQLVVSNEDANKLLRLEILDTTTSNTSDDEGTNPAFDHLYWSSAVVVVYDITNQQSFQNAIDTLRDIKREKANHVCLLLGNKVDLEHQREVTQSEAIEQVDLYTNCLNSELSAASSDYTSIADTFQSLFSLSQTVMSKANVKRRRSIVDMAKAFSTLLRSGSTKHSDAKTSS